MLFGRSTTGGLLPSQAQRTRLLLQYTHTSCYSSYAAENSTTTPATASATTKRTYTSRGGKVRLNTRARWPTATAERPSTRTPAIATPASSCSRIWSSSATVHRLLVVAVAVAPELPRSAAAAAAAVSTVMETGAPTTADVGAPAPVGALWPAEALAAVSNFVVRASVAGRLRPATITSAAVAPSASCARIDASSALDHRPRRPVPPVCAAVLEKPAWTCRARICS